MFPKLQNVTVNLDWQNDSFVEGDKTLRTTYATEFTDVRCFEVVTEGSGPRIRFRYFGMWKAWLYFTGYLLTHDHIPRLMRTSRKVLPDVPEPRRIHVGGLLEMARHQQDSRLALQLVAWFPRLEWSLFDSVQQSPETYRKLTELFLTFDF